MEIPDRPVSFVPAKAGDVLTLGTMTLRVMEDGSNTDMRLSSVELIVPPNTRGPPPHWHEMHDETFLITKGTIRFYIPPAGPDGKRKPAEIIDAQAGDYVVVPTRSPHTFSNPTDAEARFFNTFTPAFYINYFKLLAELSDEGRPAYKGGKSAGYGLLCYVAGARDVIIPSFLLRYPECIEGKRSILRGEK